MAKNKIVSKKYLIGGIILVILALVFIWWIGAKAEEIANLNDVSIATTTSQKSGGITSFFSTLFGKEKEKTANPIDKTKNTKSSEVVAVKPLTISIRDLKITKNETSSSHEVYGKQLATILKPLGTVRPNENNLLLQLLENDNEETALKIYQAGKVHFQILSNLKKITVPESAAPIQLEIMKILSQTTAQLANMSKADKDPALAISNGLAYQKTALLLFTAIGKLNEYFIAKGVTFTAEDKIVIYINVDEI